MDIPFIEKNIKPSTPSPIYYDGVEFTNSNVVVERMDTYSSTPGIILANTDTLTFLKTVPNKSIDLIATSPPYNIGKEYEVKEELDIYLEKQLQVIQECHRILKPTGSICWEVGNYIKNGEVYPLDIYFYDIFKHKMNMELRNRIVWFYGNGIHATKRFSGRYETILWFSKTDKYKFQIDPIRIPQKYPGARNSSPKGKNPSNVWEIIKEDFESGLFKVTNVCHGHSEKDTRHPCQFPIELVERLVLSMTDKGDTVLDPYMGIGTSVIAASLHNRKAIGIDKEKQYVDIAEERVQLMKDGQLRKRALGAQPIQPSPNSKQCQKPG